MNYTLEELVYLAKQGDRDAFSEIVKQMQQKIFQYCYPMVGNRQDAEDIVQDVFVRAYENLTNYKEFGSFTGWLFTIAHRICLNKIRKRGRFSALIRRVASEDASRSKLKNLDISNEEVLSLLDSLDLKVRGIVILKVLHDMSYEEISIIVGIKSANLRKQFERARRKLQREYDIEQGEYKRGVKYEH